MKIAIEIPDQVVADVVKSIMENMPEASQSMNCVRWKYEEMRFSFVDYEDGQRYDLDREKLLATFPLMFTDKWPPGLESPPMTADWKEWDSWLCRSDADSFDAFVQLACFGSVIYG